MEIQVEIWKRQFQHRGIHMFQAAHDALMEFGGLKVTGQEDVPTGVGKSEFSFEINPELLLNSKWLSAEWGAYPIGKLYLADTCSILMDEEGWVYADDCRWVYADGHGWNREWEFRLVAPSMREALGQFIKGAVWYERTPGW